MTADAKKFDWDRVFRGIASTTFGVQLISILILFGAALVFFLMLTGIWGYIVAIQDLFIFVLLIGSGLAFLLFIWLLGLFLRFHRRVERFILGKGVGDVDADNPASKTILTLFAVAVLFVLVAGIYGYYLLWKYILQPWGNDFLISLSVNGILFYEIGMIVVFFAIGAIIVTFVMQILTSWINRYAGRLVARVKDTTEV
ncbi:MAG: hypothetical protein ACFE89_08915 [Candidatus Hodarchaeota archaeon]